MYPNGVVARGPGKLVYLPRDEADLRGRLLPVRIEKTSPWALQGVPSLNLRRLRGLTRRNSDTHDE